MTQLIDLTINDGSATPVARLFSADRGQSGTEGALWYYKAGSARTSYARLTNTVRRSGSNAATKATLLLTFPKVDVNGIELYRLIGKIEITAPDVCTQDDLNNVHAFLANAMQNAVIKSSMKDLSPVL